MDIKELTPIQKHRALVKARWDALEEQHGNIEEEMSNCCGAKIVYTDICKDCKDHCGTVYAFQDGFTCDEDGDEIV